jgi:hypothetical protein
LTIGGVKSQDKKRQQSVSQSRGNVFITYDCHLMVSKLIQCKQNYGTCLSLRHRQA